MQSPTQGEQDRDLLFPTTREGTAPLQRNISTVAQLLLLFSVLNLRRTKAESISILAYPLLLPCVTLSESVTRLKPETPQLCSRPASFFFCKEQRQKENKLELYPYCAFLLTAIVAADQASAGLLLFPVQTAKEIKPEFQFRGDFSSGHEHTSPASGEDETLWQHKQLMTALDFQPASRCRGTRSASCRHPLDLTPAEISQTKESKSEFTPVSNQFSSNSGHHIHRDQLKPAEITPFPTGCIVTNTEGEHLRLQRTQHSVLSGKQSSAI